MRCWRPETNRVAGFWYMALREIPGRIIDGILSFITLITSFVLMVTGKERKALHDWIAGTVVLHDPNKVLVQLSLRASARRPGSLRWAGA